MASNTALALLRTNVGFASADSVPSGVNDILVSNLDTAAADLLRMGISLDETHADDVNLQVMYATWLYNKRKTGEGRPQMLRDCIHDRQVALGTRSAQ